MTSKMGYGKNGKQSSSNTKMYGKKCAGCSGDNCSCMKSAQGDLPGPRKA